MNSIYILITLYCDLRLKLLISTECTAWKLWWLIRFCSLVTQAIAFYCCFPPSENMSQEYRIQSENTKMQEQLLSLLVNYHSQCVIISYQPRNQARLATQKPYALLSSKPKTSQSTIHAEGVGHTPCLVEYSL